MAFQIIDDIFDFVAQEREIGKPVGNDLREGHVTLPLIGALEHSPVAERTRVLDLIRRGEHLNGRWDEVVEFVKGHGGIQHARDRATGYAVAAREALGPATDSPHHQALALAVDHVIDRAR
jgi:geranylgeranyl pyrophosphate synthase